MKKQTASQLVMIALITVTLSGCIDSTVESSAIDAYEKTVHKVTTAHCDGGDCHSGGAPGFAVSDVTQAFSLVIERGWIDTANPSQSAFVTEINENHGSWSGNVNGDKDVVLYSIESYIEKRPAGSKASSYMTNELQSFSSTLHPLISEHCGQCHQTDDQPPVIADSNVQASYNAILSLKLVDFNEPVDSALVKQLSESQHYCWSYDCSEDATILAHKIEQWREGIVIQPSNEDTDKAAFQDTLYPNLVQNCGACHSSGNTLPYFGDSSPDTAFIALSSESLIDLNEPSQSNIIKTITDGHPCDDFGIGGDCALVSQSVANEIRKWKWLKTN